MASDEIVWQVMNQQFCSYKIKLDKKSQTFCRNEHNLTGFCNRQSCPLANSRYATVRSDPAIPSNLYLYIKTPERVHLPSQWWEKIRLPQNYEKALALIDEKLPYWNKFTIHKCKQRLTRLTQVAIRERRIIRENERLGEKLVPRLASKVKRREDTRERKAESAAKVERSIERELIERLRSGAYGNRPLNVEETMWKKVLKGLERAQKGEELGLEDSEEEREEEREIDVEYVSDLEGESEAGEIEDVDDWFDGDSPDDDDDDEDETDESDGGDNASDDDDDDDDEEAEDDDSDGKPSKLQPGGKRKRPGLKQPKARKQGPPKMRIEYELETEEAPRETVLLS